MMENEETYCDSTTASELEIFIARLEEILCEWHLHQKPLEKKLEKNDFQLKEWCSRAEKVTFAEVEFQVVRYYLKCTEESSSIQDKGDFEDNCFSQALDDLLSLENDFFPVTIPPTKDSHPLARWYGLRDFVVLIPKLSSLVSSESQIKLLLSSLSIATNNISCPVPFFIQTKEPWQCYFLGVCQSRGYHTDFEMIHLKRTPLHCKYLTGLLTLFKSKIGTVVNSPVTISVCFTYILRDWAPNTWAKESEPDGTELEQIGVSEISTLPFGATFDPIQELQLSATWPYLIENTVVDGESYSDLEPMQAPLWKASICTVDNASCLLSDYFTEFVSVGQNTQTMKELLGNLLEASNPDGNDLSLSLNAITESKMAAFSKAMIGTDKISRKQKKLSEQMEGPIPNDILMLLLYYLFPDADKESKSPYPEQFSENSTSGPEEERSGSDPRLNGMKSAPYDSLPWRLAIVMANVIHSLGGVQSAAHLWYEFTKELRYRWDFSILIPGLENTFPDSRTCLLNQKLQLLNCCISKKIEREKRARKQAEEDSDSDVEFYDCSSDVESTEDDIKVRKPKVASSDRPTGRLTRHGELRLLETGEFLYIPKTQDAIPKTEDQLEEDAEALLQLGTDAQGSEARARLMSASLLSDMEAFKAANPGCILADFIRWYSPRDWIQDEGQNEFGQPNGHLSNRMQIPGNTWLEVWEIAKPIPTKWQIRLFNDTRESERVFEFFEKRNPNGFIELLLPIMTSCVIHKLIEESISSEILGVSDLILKLIKKTERLQRATNMASRYKELINDVYAIELLFVQSNSLKRKFLPALNEKDSSGDYSELIAFINNLLSKVETEVPGGPKSGLRSVIRRYFAEASKIEQSKSDQSDQKWSACSPFPFPTEKEMILRCGTPTGPQRLHAVLRKNECRLCGAFTKDDNFY